MAHQVPPLAFSATIMAVEAILDHPPDMLPDVAHLLHDQLTADYYVAVTDQVLQRLVKYYPHKLNDKLLEALIHPGTTKLQLPPYTRISDAGLRKVVNKCKNIKHLHLSSNESYGKFISQLCGTNLLPGALPLNHLKLTSINLNRCEEIFDNGVKAILRRMPTLRQLHLVGCPNITNEVFLLEHLQLERDPSNNQIPFKACLSCVDISSCSQLHSTAVIHLTTLCGPSLRSVNISKTSVDFKALWYLAGHTMSSLTQVLEELCGAETSQVVPPGELKREETHEECDQDLVPNHSEAPSVFQKCDNLDTHADNRSHNQCLKHQENYTAKCASLIQTVTDSDGFVKANNLLEQGDEDVVDPEQVTLDEKISPLQSGMDNIKHLNACTVAQGLPLLETSEGEARSGVVNCHSGSSCSKTDLEPSALFGNVQELVCNPADTSSMTDPVSDPISADSTHILKEEDSSLKNTAGSSGCVHPGDSVQCNTGPAPWGICTENIKPRPLYISHLQSIDISFIPFPDKVSGTLCLTSMLKHNPNLQHLKLSWKDIDDQILGDITAHCPNLRSLSLIDCLAVTSKGLAALCRHCDKLQSLELQGVNFIEDCGLKSLFRNSHVTKLFLSETMISDETVKEISSNYQDTLTELDLSLCEEVTDEGIDLVATHCHQLRKLLLRHCMLSEMTLHLLAENCTNLQQLNLSCASCVSDANLVPIMLHLRHLKELNISWSLDVTDVGLRVILQYGTVLEHLVCIGLKQITSEPFWLLVSDKQALKRCRSALLMEKRLREKSGEVNSSDEEYDIVLPLRSTRYAPCLEKLELEWCDLTKEAELAEVVLVCRGSLLVIDYYGEEVKPGFAH